MPDIREILSALDIDDRALWSEQRTIMRRSYLNAHNQTVGIEDWKAEDDAFMDLIDIRLALLFDRAGRLQATTDILGQDHEVIEHDLKVADDRMKEQWENSRYKPAGVIAGTNLADPVDNAAKAIEEALKPSNATNMLKNGGWQ